MLCYRCGNTLGAGKYCLRCGADVTLYKRIVRLSNRYYNRGLEKARVRDLTGAAEDLSRALEIDKRNISARNLLGLVLYEMGETVQALCEWVVSTGFQPEDNPASAYVKYLQDNRLELDTASQGIRKFNFALEYARKGSEDLAIIQLEWVTSHHPKMVKAHSLLALLYYSEGKYSRAEKEIRAVLRSDVGNTFCLHMAAEMAEDIRTSQPLRRSAQRSSAARQPAVKEEKGERLKKVFEGRSGFLLRVLLTAAIFICATVWILVPTLERRRSKAVSDAVAVYGEELEGVRGRLTDSDALRQAYGVFLEMYRLDPVQPEQLKQLHSLFGTLEENAFGDELYGKLYAAWKAWLPQLDAEAASREAALTEPETEEESSSEEEGTGTAEAAQP